MFRPVLLLLAMSLGAMTNASAQTRDVAGARDYPGIGRFGGSVITGYQVKDFDAARMQGAAFKDGQPTNARRLEGRITRIAYRTNPALDPGGVAQFRDPNGEGRIRNAAGLRRRRLRRHSLSRKPSTRCRSRRCGWTVSTTAILPDARWTAAARPMPA
jgi:hypothetical protein